MKKPSGQDRTASEWNYVARATRRRRRILQSRILFCFIGNIVIHLCVKVEPSYEIKNAPRGCAAHGKENICCRSKFLSKLLKTFDKTFREIFPVFISTKRREKPSAFFDNNFVNNAYFSEAASSSSSHLASSSSKAPISSRMTCLCLWSS